LARPKASNGLTPLGTKRVKGKLQRKSPFSERPSLGLKLTPRLGKGTPSASFQILLCEKRVSVLACVDEPIMTRRRTFCAVGLLLAALVPAVLLTSGEHRKPPKYVPGAPASLAAFTVNYYDFLAGNPFEGDRLWMWTMAGTNAHNYLYDLAHRTILGELIAASPVLYDRQNGRVLVMTASEPIRSAGEELENFLMSISFPHGTPIPGSQRQETFAMLDLVNNTCTKMGEIRQMAGAGSTWDASPDDRYGFTSPTTDMESSFVLCDLASGTFTKIKEAGDPVGWWTEHEILMVNGTNEFDLFEVGARKRKTFFSPAYVKAFLEHEQLANVATNLRAFPNWNGRGYDLYFTSAESWGGLQHPDSFLLKADKASIALKVVYRSFRFRWGAHLDRAATHYLYPGETGAAGSGGDGSIYLQNLTNGTTLTLVPPDNLGQYSTPAFYGDEVIFFHNRILWRVQIDGSNKTELFPNKRKGINP
jgi:hypothetical protein